MKEYIKNHKFKDLIVFIEAEDWKDEYSSTKVRTMLLNGEPVDSLIDKKVLQYIRDKKLWSTQIVQ